MFNTNQLSTLENTLAQVLSNSAFINTSKAPKPLSVNQTFNVNGRTITSLTSCSKNDDILIVQDSITKKYYCIAGQSSSIPNRELSKNVVLSRQTKPRERLVGNPTCEILKLAFVYRIINNDKSQDIWLSDFNGKQHFIKNIPPALNYGDMTYTIEITYPEYTWKRYDITYEYTRQLSSTTYNVTGAELWDMSIASDYLPNYDADVEGVSPQETFFVNLKYSCSHPFGAPPPSPYYGTRYFEAADLVIPKYIVGEDNPGFVPNPSRPPTSIFVAAGSEDGNYPFEISWAGLNDTSGTYPAIFDADGGLLASEVPYYFSAADDDYWGVSLSNQIIPNPGGIGNEIGNIRNMVAVSTFRYREFNGSISFNIPVGEVRPYPENELAETEVYLSYLGKTGKLKILVRDSGRPMFFSPGLNCQPGVENGDYFLNVSKYELSDGGLVTPESLPAWMTLVDSPDRINDILRDIRENGSDIYEFINYQILSELAIVDGGRDFFVNENGYIPIKNEAINPPNLESVYGWLFEVPNTESVKAAVLAQEVTSFDYYIEPIQVDLNLNLSYDSVGFGGGTKDSDALPILGSTNVNQIKVNFTPPEIQGITQDNFEVLEATVSWSSNTFEYCFDLTQIVPIVLGGS
jgi:hypothetical protein